jgi:hypothetical protein
MRPKGEVARQSFSGNVGSTRCFRALLKPAFMGLRWTSLDTCAPPVYGPIRSNESLRLLPRDPGVGHRATGGVHRPVGMAPEACTWPFLPLNVIAQTASLRVFEVTNRVNMTLTPIRSSFDLGWSRSIRRVTFQTPTAPCRRPAWFMTNSVTPFTAMALSDAHPYVHSRP